MLGFDGLKSALLRGRADCLLASVLVLGSLGFRAGYTPLAQELSPPPIAQVAIAAKPAIAPTPEQTPNGYGAGPRHAGSDNFANTNASAPGAKQTGQALPGGGQSGPIALPQHDFAAQPRLAVGIGSGPLGGFSGVAHISRSAPAVPEPSTWAMIIVGVVLVSFKALRQRSP